MEELVIELEVRVGACDHGRVGVRGGLEFNEFRVGEFDGGRRTGGEEMAVVAWRHGERLAGGDGGEVYQECLETYSIECAMVVAYSHCKASTFEGCHLI